MEISSYIDYTLLKANATEKEISDLCKTALENNYQAVCVNPYMVKLAKKCLFNTAVKVVCVVGFPLGANTLETKIFETKQALENEADEIDFVINQTELKEKNVNYITNEIAQLKNICKDKILKVIIETSNLDDNLLSLACRACINGHADYIKTSTGLGAGATPEIVAKIRSLTKNKIKIKASGKIRTKSQAQALIEAGAMRIGTSSKL